jgi:hypothetical protein
LWVWLVHALVIHHNVLALLRVLGHHSWWRASLRHAGSGCHRGPVNRRALCHVRR